MSGRDNSSGVGRGNGAGSRVTRFKKGEPSPNPRGRPRKAKPAAADTDLQSAMRRALAETVEVHENGVKRRMPRVDAMAATMLAQFHKSKSRDQIAFYRLITQGLAPVAEVRSGAPSSDAVAEFLNGIAEAIGYVDGAYVERASE